MFFIYVIIGFVTFDALWWLLADRLARRTNTPRRWRLIVGAIAGLQMLGIALLMLARLIGMRGMIMPELAVIELFLWHFIVVFPAVLVSAVFVWVGRRRKRAVATANEIALSPSSPESAGAGEISEFSRRDFLTRAVIALPPLATVALTGQSKWAEDHLIRRDVDLPIANLPAALEGLTIAHVTDPHLGSFITEAKIRKIIAMTNEIDADLVLQTGDLINTSLGDLPDGIDMLRQFRARRGVYSIQGNHDCIQDRDKFTTEVKKAGQMLLVDEAADLYVNGARLRLIGLPWVGYQDNFMAWRTAQLLDQTRGEAFPILMAHHPHAFDTAAAAGIPLTLSGHTHGGQVALTKHIGAGPIMYRYWSGAYRKNNSTCYVSNGTGNWFPLRINVPCEILKLTLRRA
jgi:predicted MPP superfamily phosphohydrolase